MITYERAGLGVLNSLARLGSYRLTEHRFGDHPQESVDWYHIDDTAPTVVFCHGGNWRSYDKRQFRFVADTLSGMGVNVLLPNFQKYPEVRFDEILAGAVKAVDFAMSEILPCGDVVLMGHSSGAQLAALMTLNAELLSSPERVVAMIGLSGPYDFYPFTDDDHWDLFGPEALYPMSQPVNFVRPDAPELYLLHGADDNRVRRGHSKSLMEKQLAAGGLASREVYEGMGHADALISFSRIHRRNSTLVRDIQSFFESRLTYQRGNLSGCQ